MRDLPVLALDFGLRRLGIAVGQFDLGIVHPQESIWEHENKKRFVAIASVVSIWKPVALVVGIPYHLDGTPHEFTKRCLRFSRQLSSFFPQCSVFGVNELLSTRQAHEYLQEAQVYGRRRKKAVDSIAAAIILERFFDEYVYDHYQGFYRRPVS